MQNEININKTLFKYLENFDEDFSMSDFTPEELNEIVNSNKKVSQKFKDDYFKKYNDVKSPSLKRQDW
ncbi:MAG: hypothetical protein ACI4TI_01180 [Christensenellales bacterium]